MMPSNSTTPPPVPAGPTVYDLLKGIACFKNSEVAEDAKKAKILFDELLATYEWRLLSIIKKQLPYSGATVHLDPGDLYWKVAHKIWEKADRFIPSRTDPNGIREQFLRWTYVILRNIISDTIAPLKEELTSTESWQDHWDQFNQDVPDKSDRAKLAVIVLEKMDPKYAEVLFWTVSVRPTDGSQMRPSKEDRDKICRDLDITPDNLRQRRARAFQILKREIKILEKENAARLVK
jgi:DNA-directed RNA polymerase specialized sigma24 family protein